MYYNTVTPADKVSLSQTKDFKNSKYVNEQSELTQRNNCIVHKYDGYKLLRPLQFLCYAFLFISDLVSSAREECEVHLEKIYVLRAFHNEWLGFLSGSAGTILRNGYIMGWLPAVPFAVIPEMELLMFQRIIDFFKIAFL